MLRVSLVLSVVCCACGARVVDGSLDAGRDDAGNISGCAVDVDCGAGMVCEGCGAGTAKECVPGCRTSEQCPPSMACTGPVACVTCPCAPGWCDLDPCRDVDGDGYVPTSLQAANCPGKLPGDCDDSRSSVHPGGVEVCANGLDDDCDGKYDQQDTASCDQCGSGSYSCSATLHCQGGQQCSRGCCVACPVVHEPTCGTGECRQEGPYDANGCRQAPTCVQCATCPGYAPVCGENYATYQNACLAQAAGVAVLHQGDCVGHEGLACTPFDWCGSSLYCGVSTKTCLVRPSCFVDDDCALAVQQTVLCGDGGIASLVCEQHKCMTHCP